jgi:hypothetical protein
MIIIDLCRSISFVVIDLLIVLSFLLADYGMAVMCDGKHAYPSQSLLAAFSITHARHSILRAADSKTLYMIYSIDSFDSKQYFQFLLTGLEV